MSDPCQTILPSPSALRVLLLEDQTFQRQLLVGLLKSCGVADIVQAADGNEGLAALDADDRGFDIAICDLKMDGMDGIEFIRHAARRKVCGFIVTSALESQLLSYATELGAGFGAPILGTLPKPVTVASLNPLLQLHCRRMASARSDHLRESGNTYQWTRDEIVRAMDADQFVPYFQPKIRLDNFALEGVEILARWEHDALGVRPPLEFIEPMEREGLIDRLTETIFRKALDCAAAWHVGHANIGMAINVSPLTLQKLDATRHILSLVKQSDVLPDQLTIEVTETAVSKDSAGLLETLTRLRMQGFNVSVDDFGTGYSSLLQLSELPFNEIKIDRTFVHGASNNHKASVILESIINLAQRLNIRTVAEGIETKDEMRFIQQLGCSVGQGFFFHKPMSETNFLTYLATR